MKALSDAMWRKKKQEQLENVDAGLSLAGSVISEKPIMHTDAATVASLSNIYKTSYNQLAAEKVRDYIELPQPVKTLPAYTMEMLAKSAADSSLDKYALKHYTTLKEHAVKSWEGMEGSLITASVYSASSKGFGSEINAQSYDEYNQIRANKSMSSSISTAVSSRVGSLLQSRTGSQAGITAAAGSNNNKYNINNAASNDIGSDHSLMMLSQLLGRNRDSSPTAGSRSKYSSSGVTRNTAKTGSRSVQKKQIVNQIRLAPLLPPLSTSANSLSLPPSNIGSARSSGAGGAHKNYPGGVVGESGLDNLSMDRSVMEDSLGPGSVVSASGFSALSADSRHTSGGASVSSPQSLSMSLSMSALSMYNNSLEGDSSTLADHPRTALDPVFYKEQTRNHWGRKHPVGKLRKAEISWGMQSYQDPNRGLAEEEDEDLDTSASAASKAAPSLQRQGSTLSSNSQRRMISTANSTRSGTSGSTRNFKDPLQPPPAPPTVKSRSLTVYHPDMHIFQDAVTLSKKKSTTTVY